MADAHSFNGQPAGRPPRPHVPSLVPAETAQYMISDATAEERLVPNGPADVPPPPPVLPPPRVPAWPAPSWPLLLPFEGDEPLLTVVWARSGEFSLPGTEIERLIGLTIGI